MTSTTISMAEQHPVSPNHPSAFIPVHSTIDDLLRSYVAEGLETPLVAYPVKGISDFEEYTANDLDRFADAAVARYINTGLEPADPNKTEAPIVAILAPSSLDVVVSIFALNRLGWGILFLSTRLTASAHARLLQMADCSTLISTASFGPTVQDIQKLQEVKSIPMLERIHYRDISVTKFHRKCNPWLESRKIAWILHSSGSTGFPKPIFLTNYACLANFCKTLAHRAFCTSPLFHSHGLMELFRCIYSKNTFYIGNFSFPVTRQNLIEAMNIAKPEMLCAVPYVIKLLAESEEGIRALVQTKLVLYAGSSCPDILGDKLEQRGVNVVANYGAYAYFTSHPHNTLELTLARTETGQIMTSFRPPGDHEWSWMRLKRPVSDHVLMDEISPGIYECVALDGLPSKGPSNSDNPPNSFRTRDLFIRHPDPNKPNHWKYISRLDDRITLVNGEKVLPIPFEGLIRQSELVQEAVVIGVGRMVPGLLLFPSNQAAQFEKGAYLDTMWPLIEYANNTSETFGRIPRNLVVVMPIGAEYPRTDKGTFIRLQLYEQYSGTIDDAYRSFEEAGAGTMKLDVPKLEKWLLEKFRVEFNIVLDTADTDIFSAGVDSLQTMRLWGLITKELDLAGRSNELSQNIVFEQGNVKSLAKYLHAMRVRDTSEAVDEIQIMNDMIQRYSGFKKKLLDNPIKHAKDCVLVTGTTGNLGGYLLAGLVKMDNVSEIVAPVRAANEDDARSRIFTSLSSRGIHLTNAERSKVIAFPSDLSRADLGLPKESRQDILSRLTHVIHSAWAVNFNLGVRSFEDQHIRGVFNLLNICLCVRQSSPAKFFFCSSVSVAGGTPKPATIPEKAIENLHHSQNTGYGRSKLVSEHIVREAMRSTGMMARILRIGQLAGDGATGNWNDTEALPLMIRSALSIGVLPKLDEVVSWLPVDVCASAVLRIIFPGLDQGEYISDSSHDADLVYHILNPQRFHWTRDILPELQKTKLPPFEIVTVDEWLQRLHDSDQDPINNPTAKLYDFYCKKYTAINSLRTMDGSKIEAKGSEDDAHGLLFETRKTIEHCKLLASVPDLIQEGYINRYIDSWLSRWMMHG